MYVVGTPERVAVSDSAALADENLIKRLPAFALAHLHLCNGSTSKSRNSQGGTKHSISVGGRALGSAPTRSVFTTRRI